MLHKESKAGTIDTSRSRVIVSLEKLQKEIYILLIRRAPCYSTERPKNLKNNAYHKVMSSNTSHFEAHAGFF